MSSRIRLQTAKDVQSRNDRSTGNRKSDERGGGNRKSDERTGTGGNRNTDERSGNRSTNDRSNANRNSDDRHNANGHSSSNRNNNNQSDNRSGNRDNRDRDRDNRGNSNNTNNQQSNRSDRDRDNRGNNNETQKARNSDHNRKRSDRDRTKSIDRPRDRQQQNNNSSNMIHNNQQYSDQIHHRSTNTNSTAASSGQHQSRKRSSRNDDQKNRSGTSSDNKNHHGNHTTRSKTTGSTTSGNQNNNSSSHRNNKQSNNNNNSLNQQDRSNGRRATPPRSSTNNRSERQQGNNNNNNNSSSHRPTVSLVENNSSSSKQSQNSQSQSNSNSNVSNMTSGSKEKETGASPQNPHRPPQMGRSAIGSRLMSTTNNNNNSSSSTVTANNKVTVQSSNNSSAAAKINSKFNNEESARLYQERNTFRNEYLRNQQRSQSGSYGHVNPNDIPVGGNHHLSSLGSSRHGYDRSSGGLLSGYNNTRSSDHYNSRRSSNIDDRDESKSQYSNEHSWRPSYSDHRISSSDHYRNSSNSYKGYDYRPKDDLGLNDYDRYNNTSRWSFDQKWGPSYYQGPGGGPPGLGRDNYIKNQIQNQQQQQQQQKLSLQDLKNLAAKNSARPRNIGVDNERQLERQKIIQELLSSVALTSNKMLGVINGEEKSESTSETVAKTNTTQDKANNNTTNIKNSWDKKTNNNSNTSDDTPQDQTVTSALPHDLKKIVTNVLIRRKKCYASLQDHKDKEKTMMNSMTVNNNNTSKLSQQQQLVLSNFQKTRPRPGLLFTGGLVEAQNIKADSETNNLDSSSDPDAQNLTSDLQVILQKLRVQSQPLNETIQKVMKNEDRFNLEIVKLLKNTILGLLIQEYQNPELVAYDESGRPKYELNNSLSIVRLLRRVCRKKKFKLENMMSVTQSSISDLIVSEIMGNNVLETQLGNESDPKKDVNSNRISSTLGNTLAITTNRGSSVNNPSTSIIQNPNDPNADSDAALDNNNLNTHLQQHSPQLPMLFHSVLLSFYSLVSSPLIVPLVNSILLEISYESQQNLIDYFVRHLSDNEINAAEGINDKPQSEQPQENATQDISKNDINNVTVPETKRRKLDTDKTQTQAVVAVKNSNVNDENEEFHSVLTSPNNNDIMQDAQDNNNEVIELSSDNSDNGENLLPELSPNSINDDDNPNNNKDNINNVNHIDLSSGKTSSISALSDQEQQQFQQNIENEQRQMRRLQHAKRNASMYNPLVLKIMNLSNMDGPEQDIVSLDFFEDLVGDSMDLFRSSDLNNNVNNSDDSPSKLSNYRPGINCNKQDINDPDVLNNDQRSNYITDIVQAISPISSPENESDIEMQLLERPKTPKQLQNQNQNQNENLNLNLSDIIESQSDDHCLLSTMVMKMARSYQSYSKSQKRRNKYSSDDVMDIKLLQNQNFKAPLVFLENIILGVSRKDCMMLKKHFPNYLETLIDNNNDNSKFKLNKLKGGIDHDNLNFQSSDSNNTSFFQQTLNSIAKNFLDLRQQMLTNQIENKKKKVDRIEKLKIKIKQDLEQAKENLTTLRRKKKNQSNLQSSMDLFQKTSQSLQSLANHNHNAHMESESKHSSSSSNSYAPFGHRSSDDGRDGGSSDMKSNLNDHNDLKMDVDNDEVEKQIQKKKLLFSSSDQKNLDLLEKLLVNKRGEQLIDTDLYAVFNQEIQDIDVNQTLNKIKDYVKDTMGIKELTKSDSESGKSDLIKITTETKTQEDKHSQSQTIFRIPKALLVNKIFGLFDPCTEVDLLNQGVNTDGDDDDNTPAGSESDDDDEEDYLDMNSDTNLDNQDTEVASKTQQKLKLKSLLRSQYSYQGESDQDSILDVQSVSDEYDSETCDNSRFHENLKKVTQRVTTAADATTAGPVSDSTQIKDTAIVDANFNLGKLSSSATNDLDIDYCPEVDDYYSTDTLKQESGIPYQDNIFRNIFSFKPSSYNDIANSKSWKSISELILPSLKSILPLKTRLKHAINVGTKLKVQQATNLNLNVRKILSSKYNSSNPHHAFYKTAIGLRQRLRDIRWQAYKKAQQQNAQKFDSAAAREKSLTANTTDNTAAAQPTKPKPNPRLKITAYNRPPPRDLRKQAVWITRLKLDDYQNPNNIAKDLFLHPTHRQLFLNSIQDQVIELVGASSYRKLKATRDFENRDKDKQHTQYCEFRTRFNCNQQKNKAKAQIVMSKGLGKNSNNNANQLSCKPATKGGMNNNNWQLNRNNPFSPLCQCNKIHFRKIIKPWTDQSLGDCSYLNTCRKMHSCRYVHYTLDLTLEQSRDIKKKLHRSGGIDMTFGASGGAQMPNTMLNDFRKINENKSSLANTRTTNMAGSLGKLGQSVYGAGVLPPQWINCDVRNFDFSILNQKSTVLMLDPPWDIHMELPYGTLKDFEMIELEIEKIHGNLPNSYDIDSDQGGSDTDGGGVIFLWITARAAELARDCMKKWGYRRIEELIWVKTNQLQRVIRTGRTGHWLNHSKEHCIIGVKVNSNLDKELKRRQEQRIKGAQGPGPLQGGLFGSGLSIFGPTFKGNRNLDCDVLVSEVRETSRKPDEIYSLIERMFPQSLKIEIFGRPHNVHPNWLTLGNQLLGVHLCDQEIVDRYNNSPLMPVKLNNETPVIAFDPSNIDEVNVENDIEKMDLKMAEERDREEERQREEEMRRRAESGESGIMMLEAGVPGTMGHSVVSGGGTIITSTGGSIPIQALPVVTMGPGGVAPGTIIMSAPPPQPVTVTTIPQPPPPTMIQTTNLVLTQQGPIQQQHQPQSQPGQPIAIPVQQTQQQYQTVTQTTAVPTEQTVTYTFNTNTIQTVTSDQNQNPPPPLAPELQSQPVSRSNSKTSQTTRNKKRKQRFKNARDNYLKNSVQEYRDQQMQQGQGSAVSSDVESNNEQNQNNQTTSNSGSSSEAAAAATGQGGAQNAWSQPLTTTTIAESNNSNIKPVTQTVTIVSSSSDGNAANVPKAVDSNQKPKIPDYSILASSGTNMPTMSVLASSGPPIGTSAADTSGTSASFDAYFTNQNSVTNLPNQSQSQTQNKTLSWGNGSSGNTHGWN